MLVLENVTTPTENVKFTEESVQIYHDAAPLGNGTLYITDKAVTWVTRENKGFSITFPSIILHAVSTDTENFAEEHIFVMVDARKSEKKRRRVPVLMTQAEAQMAQDLQIATNELEEEEDDDDSSPSVQLRIVPSNKDHVNTIYHEIIVGQENNPEEDDMPSEEDDEMAYGEGEAYDGEMQEGQWFTAESADNIELSEEGLANLNRMMGGGNQHNGHGDHHDDDEKME